MKSKQFEVQPFRVLTGDDLPTELEAALNEAYSQGYEPVGIVPGYGDPNTNTGMYCSSKIVLFRKPRESEIVGTPEWENAQKRDQERLTDAEYNAMWVTLCLDQSIADSDPIVQDLVQRGVLSHSDGKYTLTAEGKTLYEAHK